MLKNEILHLPSMPCGPDSPLCPFSPLLPLNEAVMFIGGQ